ncbi:complex I NDUFA9 subunit family protein [Geotalea toluenoxydans]|uniref:complex I NDUFA9 subunit family protein n=1 Tax=Geotalea toluenoxydans TaxID=421624 RepID=UPI0006D07B82|nr:complex I NDUFA9 subunit family protein [Geotalea toluenoxydans]
MNIFVSGGTGFVGGHLRKALLERGHHLKLLAHRPSDSYEPGVEQVDGDVTRPETFVRHFAGCDAVINLVGIIREFPSRGVTFQRLHVEATRNQVEAAKQAGVKRYLQMSALGTREGATSMYHRTKYQAEQFVRDSRLDYTIFRPSIVFGPKDDFINKLAGMIRNLPAVPVIGDGKYRLQPIAGDDVARCFAMALEMPETIGKTYELCGSTRLSYNDLLDCIGRALGKSHVSKIPNPLVLMKLVVPLFQNIPAFPITMDQLLMLIEENICDGAWRDTFGFEPQDFDTGIRGYLH